MIDPVSEALRQRRDEPTPWGPAVAAALVLHLAAAAAAFLAPRGPSRPLTLPSVRVRTVLEAVPVAPSRPAPPSAPAAAPPQTKAPPSPAPRRDTSPSRPATAAPAAPRPRPKGAADQAPPGPPPSPAAASAGGISVGAGGADSAVAFPYQYYLDRLLALVQSNWFRPTAPPGTSCRVRCRITRSGGLVEAGIEVSSGYPAYDRAALRAVYAGAPYPPLPEAFGGRDLTIHLEFGP